ncbi:MAG TPA: histidine--tRNA ligase, partial [Cyanobacteria bacterium UBA11691]|nr:histidine--tRNA ligase [Cyanobacteria bacterium UBA11691]
GAIACLILGDREAEQQEVQLKWMSAKEQQTLEQSDLLSNTPYLRQQLDKHC